MKDIDKLLENWNETETKLNESMELNQQLVKKMIRKKPSTIWKKILKYHSFEKRLSIIFCVLGTAVTILSYEDPGLFFYLLICVLALTPYYFFKKTELKYVKRVDLGNDSIKDSIVKITEVFKASKIMLHKSFYYLLIVPILMICNIATQHHVPWSSFWSFEWLVKYGNTFFSNQTLSIPIFMIIGGLLSIYLYQSKIFNRIKLLKSNLEELEELETSS